MAKLHIGCGPEIKAGWLNIDVRDVNHPDFLNHDLLKGLPENLKDIEYCYSSHFLEHLTYDECEKLVKEIHSKMARGGVFRCSVPCFKKTMQAYMNNDMSWFA